MGMETLEAVEDALGLEGRRSWGSCWKGEQKMGELWLSPELSEYLFTSGFWDRVNERCGRAFGRFEEDEVEGSALGVMVEELGRVVGGLKKARGVANAGALADGARMYLGFVEVAARWRWLMRVGL